MPKVLKATLILTCMQKINLPLSSILRYCTDIVNLLFWELWKCLTISIKIIGSICSKFSCLPPCKKSTSSFTSLLRYCREITNILFCVSWARLATHIKNDSITLKKRLTLISREKTTPSFKLSLRYCKDIIKLLFWVLWDAWPCTPKVILSICRNFLCLSASKKSIS